MPKCNRNKPQPSTHWQIENILRNCLTNTARCWSCRARKEETPDIDIGVRKKMWNLGCRCRMRWPQIGVEESWRENMTWHEHDMRQSQHVEPWSLNEAQQKFGTMEDLIVNSSEDVFKQTKNFCRILRKYLTVFVIFVIDPIYSKSVINSLVIVGVGL